MHDIVYRNSNGITTTVRFVNGKKQLYAFSYGEKGQEFLRKRKNLKKQDYIFAKKSHEMAKIILENELITIRLFSENWGYTQRYKKILEMKKRIENNFN